VSVLPPFNRVFPLRFPPPRGPAQLRRHPLFFLPGTEGRTIVFRLLCLAVLENVGGAFYTSNLSFPSCTWQSRLLRSFSPLALMPASENPIPSGEG